MGKMEKLPKYAERFKKARNELGISQARLGEITGTLQQEWSGFERATRKPQRMHAEKLSEACAKKYSPDYLLGNTDAINNTSEFFEDKLNEAIATQKHFNTVRKALEDFGIHFIPVDSEYDMFDKIIELYRKYVAGDTVLEDNDIRFNSTLMKNGEIFLYALLTDDYAQKAKYEVYDVDEGKINRIKRYSNFAEMYELFSEIYDLIDVKCAHFLAKKTMDLRSK